MLGKVLSLTDACLSLPAKCHCERDLSKVYIRVASSNVKDAYIVFEMT